MTIIRKKVKQKFSQFLCLPPLRWDCPKMFSKVTFKNIFHPVVPDIHKAFYHLGLSTRRISNKRSYNVLSSEEDTTLKGPWAKSNAQNIGFFLVIIIHSSIPNWGDILRWQFTLLCYHAQTYVHCITTEHK